MRFAFGLATGALVALAAPAHAAPNDVFFATKDFGVRHPSIAIDARGRLYLAYSALTKDKDVPDIFFISSKDGGETWSRKIDVSNTPEVAVEPAIAVGKSNDVAIVWTDSSVTVTTEIFGSFSTDGGKTWSKPVNISNTTGKSNQPSVAISPDGAIHVVWCDNTDDFARADVWHSTSADHGKTWSKPANISSTPGISSDSAVAVGPKGEVYVTWADTTNGEKNRDVWFTASTDGGKTWLKSLDVSNTTGLSSDPDIAVDGQGAVYIVWSDTTLGTTHPDVFIGISRDGKAFAPVLDVSQTPGLSSDPSVSATGDGQIVIVWRDTTKDFKAPDIWVTRSMNGGKSFAAGSDLSNTPGVSDAPKVAVGDGHYYAVWQEREHGKTTVKGTSRVLR